MPNSPNDNSPEVLRSALEAAHAAFKDNPAGQSIIAFLLKEGLHENHSFTFGIALVGVCAQLVSLIDQLSSKACHDIEAASNAALKAILNVEVALTKNHDERLKLDHEILREAGKIQTALAGSAEAVHKAVGREIPNLADQIIHTVDDKLTKMAKKAVQEATLRQNEFLDWQDTLWTTREIVAIITFVFSFSSLIGIFTYLGYF